MSARTRRGPAGVVDERVDAAEARHALGDEPLAIGGDGDVGRAVVDGGAKSGELVDGGSDVGGGPDAADDQLPALGGQRAGDAEADAAGAAGDDGRAWRRRHARAADPDGPKNVR